MSDDRIMNISRSTEYKAYSGGRNHGREWRPGMKVAAIPGRPGQITPQSQEGVALLEEIRLDEARALYPQGFAFADGETIRASVHRRIEQIEKLERVPVVLPTVQSMQEQLAIDCEVELGYSILRRDRFNSTPGALLRTFAKLEIDILPDDKVVRYKEAMLHREHARATKNQYTDWQTHMKPVFRFHKGTADTVQVKAGMFVRWWALDFGADGRAVQREIEHVHWACTTLAGYEEQVPIHVLEKCRQLKREFPAVTFFVEELRRDKRIIDPLMLAVVGSEAVYFEVWDEPDFERAQWKD